MLTEQDAVKTAGIQLQGGFSVQRQDLQRQRGTTTTILLHASHKEQWGNTNAAGMCKGTSQLVVSTKSLKQHYYRVC